MSDAVVTWHYDPGGLELEDGTVTPELWMVRAVGGGYAWQQPVPVSAYEDEALRRSLEQQAVEALALVRIRA